jgi:hypothetical protein
MFLTETSADNQLRTRQYIPEDSELHTRRENFKSYNYKSRKSSTANYLYDNKLYITRRFSVTTIETRYWIES